MASYRNDIEHRVVIRPIEPADGFEVVHERRGPSEDT
jgi:3-methyladenine DNA glycosylase Mpg